MTSTATELGILSNLQTRTWFAWYPVKCVDDTWAWFQIVGVVSYRWPWPIGVITHFIKL